MIKFKKNSVPTLITLVAIHLFCYIFILLTMNWGSMVRYQQNKADSQILEGRITEVTTIRGYGRRSTRTYNVTIEYTENGETKTAVFKKPIGKGRGDAVELIRLPDGVLVPRYIQFPGGSASGCFALLVEVALVLAVLLRSRVGNVKSGPLSTLVQPVDDFDEYVSREEAYVSREEALMQMVTQAQNTGVNVNEEVQISEEPEAVIPVKKLDTIQDSPYSLEDLGEYEGIDLDNLVVEKLNDQA